MHNSEIHAGGCVRLWNEYEDVAELTWIIDHDAVPVSGSYTVLTGHKDGIKMDTHTETPTHWNWMIKLENVLTLKTLQEEEEPHHLNVAQKNVNVMLGIWSNPCFANTHTYTHAVHNVNLIICYFTLQVRPKSIDIYLICSLNTTHK